MWKACGLLSFWCVATLSAQEPSAAPEPRIQPTALDLGTLRKGALAEASCAVFWNDDGKDPRPGIVEVPEGIRLRLSETDEYADSGHYTEVFITIDTSALGAISKEIVVQRGSARVTVPVRAVVEAPLQGGRRVLIAEAPFEAWAAEDTADFDAWRQLVTEGSLDVDYHVPCAGEPILPTALLQRAEVVLVAGSCLLGLDAEGVQRLQGFVCGGGRLVVAANTFLSGTIRRANELVAPFGLRMQDEEPGVGQEVSGESVHEHPLTAGVDAVIPFRPSPTRIIDPKRGLALVSLPAFGDRAMIALAVTESGGEVITLGQSLYWDWAREAPGNRQLLRNLLMRGATAVEK